MSDQNVRQTQWPITSPEMRRVRAEFGVVYFHDGNAAFRNMTELSIRSLRRFHPDWPVEVFIAPSPRQEPLRWLYRRLSFWKNARRRARAGQDTRTIALKAEVMLQTPFEMTLFLDADTVVLKPLDAVLAAAREADLTVTALPNYRYFRTAKWQPAEWPGVNSGVCLFNRRFVAAYKSFVGRFGHGIHLLPTADQFILSLLCHLLKDQLTIRYPAHLQVDVLAVRDNLYEVKYPTAGTFMDLTEPWIKDFFVFHYNEEKPYYLKRIAQVMRVDLLG